MYAANTYITRPSTLEEAIVNIRWVGEKMHDNILLCGNRLTPASFSEGTLLETIDMWSGLLDEVDSELPEDITLKALNILRYMKNYLTLHPYMEAIMDFMEYRYIKQYVSISS